MSQLRTARFGSLGQRMALAATLWVAASLALAGGTFWWQAVQVGGMGSFNLPLLLPALCFAALSFGHRTLRWHFFLATVGARPPLLTSLRTQLVGFSLTMTPGKVGELYKCYLMEQRTGVPTARMAPIVLFEKLMDAFKHNRADHIAVYGPDNHMRLTGKHETAAITEFTFGVADRGASIRVPHSFVNNGYKGYLEDRRPNSQGDPYQIASQILKTIASVPTAAKAAAA